jgi:hypothetical protein
MNHAVAAVSGTNVNFNLIGKHAYIINSPCAGIYVGARKDVGKNARSSIPLGEINPDRVYLFCSMILRTR